MQSSGCAEEELSFTALCQGDGYITGNKCGTTTTAILPWIYLRCYTSIFIFSVDEKCGRFSRGGFAARLKPSFESAFLKPGVWALWWHSLGAYSMA